MGEEDSIEDHELHDPENSKTPQVPDENCSGPPWRAEVSAGGRVRAASMNRPYGTCGQPRLRQESTHGKKSLGRRRVSHLAHHQIRTDSGRDFPHSARNVEVGLQVTNR